MKAAVRGKSKDNAKKTAEDGKAKKLVKAAEADTGSDLGLDMDVDFTSAMDAALQYGAPGFTQLSDGGFESFNSQGGFSQQQSAAGEISSRTSSMFGSPFGATPEKPKKRQSDSESDDAKKRRTEKKRAEESSKKSMNDKDEGDESSGEDNLLKDDPPKRAGEEKKPRVNTGGDRSKTTEPPQPERAGPPAQVKARPPGSAHNGGGPIIDFIWDAPSKLNVLNEWMPPSRPVSAYKPGTSAQHTQVQQLLWTKLAEVDKVLPGEKMRSGTAHGVLLALRYLVDIHAVTGDHREILERAMTILHKHVACTNKQAPGPRVIRS